MTKIWKRVFAVIALLAVMTTGLYGCKKKEKVQSPYMAAVNNLAQAYNGDAAAIEKIAPEEAWRYLQKNDFDARDHADRVHNKQAAFLQDMRGLYGEDAYVSISVKDAEKCSEERIKDIAKALNDTYGLKIASVKEAYKMKRTLKIGDAEYESVEMYTVRIDDGWYVLYDHSSEETPAFYFPFLSNREISLSS